MNLNSEYIPLLSGSAHYYRQYFTDPSKHFAVSVWTSDGHPAKTDHECGSISLVNTLTGNSPENTHSENSTHIVSALRAL